MKISDEIRELAGEAGIYSNACVKLRELADRIDAEMVELPKDADGEAIHVGDTVWDVQDGMEFTVTSITLYADGVAKVNALRDGCDAHTSPTDFTHERPDSLERIADDIEARLGIGTIDGSTLSQWVDRIRKHRAVLFSVIVENFAARAWKSKLHADGTMYDGMFVVGIETPDGQATYHYDIDPYWDLFRCKEVDRAPEWDGHTPDQAIERIGKLVDCKTDRPTCKNLATKPADELLCSECGEHVDIAYVENADDYHARHCPNCGARVVSADAD